jgi:hypothetical protein
METGVAELWFRDNPGTTNPDLFCMYEQSEEAISYY